ncbi:tyrosine-type recombinase/integrase [Borborobacter arsenicus]|uniref:tyrosine-type recombinase/integrase n=1 Tax=Borborobacter arsenicus TaxID=1851146 RepID=UPI00315CFB73
MATVRKLERRGKLASAAKARTSVGQVFRFAIATGRAENDPTLALRGAIAARKVIHRPAIRDRKGFGGLLRSIWGYPHIETAAGLKLLALLYSRPSELRLATWQEFDLDAATWTIPAERMKGRKEHKKPLPVQAVAILRQHHEITGGVLVFPSIRSRRRPISDATWSAALRAMGIGSDQHVPHGFRASASTLLNESGRWSSDAIERELAHVDGNEVRRAYARGDHWQERVEMAKWWGNEIDAMRKGAEVIPLRA